jgi:hypothetical protein
MEQEEQEKAEVEFSALEIIRYSELLNERYATEMKTQSSNELITKI